MAVSCHLEREPDGLGDGWDVGVDGDSEQFGRAVWRGEGACLQGATALPGGVVPATVHFGPLPSKRPQKLPSGRGPQEVGLPSLKPLHLLSTHHSRI